MNTISLAVNYTNSDRESHWEFESVTEAKEFLHSVLGGEENFSCIKIYEWKEVDDGVKDWEEIEVIKE